MSLAKKQLIEKTLSFLKENNLPGTSLLVSKEHTKPVKTQKKTPKEAESYIPQMSFQESLKAPLEKKTKENPPLLRSMESKGSIKKNPLKEKTDLPFSELSKTVLRLFPSFPLKEIPPDDKTALAMSSPSYIKALEADVVFFSFQETRESDLFLENVKQAVLLYHTSATLFFVPSCKTEEELSLFIRHMRAKVVIGSESLLHHKFFLTSIKELPASSERFIHKSKLLLLEPFTNYFTHPKKKKVLWQILCNLLTTPASS